MNPISGRLLWLDSSVTRRDLLTYQTRRSLERESRNKQKRQMQTAF